MTRIRLTLAGAAALAIASAFAAAAQHHGSHGQHGGHGAAASSAATGTEATRAFRAANEAMHAGMDIDYTGNVEIDFVRGMIPHHQGAIDMAEVMLKHGENPELRKLAQEIIAAQTREIAWMEDWLAKNAR